MHNISEKYRIDLCEEKDIAEVMAFFARVWNPSHMLAVNRSFITEAFGNPRKGGYSILLARKNECGTVVGMLGYVPNYRYDLHLPPGDTFIWVTNWLADPAHTGLGLQLLRELYLREETTRIGTLGNNETADLIYKTLKYQVGALTHYYLVNPDIKQFKILSGHKPYSSSRPTVKNDFGLRLLSPDEAANLTSNEYIQAYEKEAFPPKNLSYLLNKYGVNPWYQYQFYGVLANDEITALLLVKKASYEGASMLRIVEYFGEPAWLAGLGNAFVKLLENENAEYLEFYCHGIEGMLLENCGFASNPEGDTIVPAYFEPFVRENITINFAYNCPQSQKFTIYRGDCDREWPRYRLQN